MQGPLDHLDLLGTLHTTVLYFPNEISPYPDGPPGEPPQAASLLAKGWHSWYS